MIKSEQTKKYIIEKSALLFNKNGYAGTSMSDITKAINLTKGAIYGNFKNKEEIALAVFDYNVSNLTDRIFDSIKDIDNSIEKLTAHANYYFTNMEMLKETGGCPIINTSVESDDMYPSLSKRVENVIRRWEIFLIRTIKKGISKQEINEFIDPKEYASLFISLIEGSTMLFLASNNIKHSEYAHKHTLHIIEKEMKKK